MFVIVMVGEQEDGVKRCLTSFLHSTVCRTG